jgi:hypothetical protein
MTQQLEERVARLELIMQRWKFTAIVALLVMATVCVVILLKERTEAEVRARAFLLVNDSGEIIARLADSPGGPVLLLHAKQANANVMVMVWIEETRPSLSFAMKTGGRDWRRVSGMTQCCG